MQFHSDTVCLVDYFYSFVSSMRIYFLPWFRKPVATKVLDFDLLAWFLIIAFSSIEY